MSRDGFKDGGMTGEIDIHSIRMRITVKGFSDEDLERCIEVYSNNNLWMRTRNGQALAWVNTGDDDEDE